MKKYVIAAFFLVSALGICAFCLLSKTERPDILLITIDALRPDHLGCYGYPRNTSPNIDKLAAEGAVFSRCFAVSSGTAYSFPNILTGKYLAVGGGYKFLNNILDQKFTTLAEYLRRAGYYTAAFVDNAHLRRGKGFEQGFDFYYGVSKKNAGQINRRILDFLGNYRIGRPLFIWVHYLDTHTPYSYIPEGCLETFMSDQLYGKNDKTLKLNPAPLRHPYASRGFIPGAAFQEGHYNLNYYLACYDCQIRHTDFYVGELLNNIKHGTFIILTADHGESLGEHGYYFAHEENIYDEVLHIPLIIKDGSYFKGGKRAGSVVSSEDIVPTILSRVRPLWYLFNKHRFDGIGLKIPSGAGESRRRYVYSYYPWAWSIRDAQKNIKYIAYGNGQEELYFLPDEETNHIDDKLPGSVRVKKELKEALRNWRNNHPAQADPNATKAPLDQETKDQLKNLGYLQ